MSEQHDTLLTAQQAIDPDAPVQQIALEQAAEWFEQYAENHTAKGTPDGDAKALTNRERAEYLRSALRTPAATSLPDGVEIDRIIAGLGRGEVEAQGKAMDLLEAIKTTPAPAQPEARDVVEAVADLHYVAKFGKLPMRQRSPDVMNWARRQALATLAQQERSQ